MTALEVRLQQQLDRRKQQSRLRILKTTDPKFVDFSSNDFLSLSTNQQFHDDYVQAVQDASRLGSTGSRLLDGNSDLAESLERNIASFHNAPAGLLTNSGFDANVSIFSYLPQSGDIVLYDELIHASVHDGMRQSRAATRQSFAHNDVNDFQQKLHKLLSSHPQATIFIAVESIYSMEGDIAPLASIVDIMKLLPSSDRDRSHLIVDEAHSNGIYGPCGRGLVSALGLESSVLIRLHTFGKALACNGAIILTSDVIRSYLINYARPLIYTTFLSHPNLLAIQTAYRWLQTPALTEPLTDHLNKLTLTLHNELAHLTSTVLNRRSRPVPNSILHIPPLLPNAQRTPIFALLTSSPRQLAAHCQSKSFMVRAVVPPTVPVGTDRVRVCLHAGNQIEEVKRLVRVVKEWVDEQMETERATSVRIKDQSTGRMEMAKL